MSMLRLLAGWSCRCCYDMKRPSGTSARPAQDAKRRDCREESGPVRIACLGDSNTVGGGLGKTGSYPAQLQRHLNEEAGMGTFVVKPFGVNGAVAVATPGKKCYEHQQRCADAAAFAPHIFVVMLGTNDAWHRAGEPQKVGDSIMALLDRLEKARSPLPLNRRCPFFLVLPPGAKDGRLRDNLAQHVHPELRRVAKARADTTLVDVLVSSDGYRPDAVHLSKQGAGQVASSVATAILRS
ncbi:axeA1 [Symbiodinium natans]|uniref:AxeA1 protein n=1 Tax=Symbiodinium natans TaxID=878477 RepID=A0A812MB17_9DINO|nr:axeA1 [Symbiodinium natans]